MSELLRSAIADVLGVTVKFIAKVEGPGARGTDAGSSARRRAPTLDGAATRRRGSRRRSPQRSVAAPRQRRRWPPPHLLRPRARRLRVPHRRHPRLGLPVDRLHRERLCVRRFHAAAVPSIRGRRSRSRPAPRPRRPRPAAPSGTATAAASPSRRPRPRRAAGRGARRAAGRGIRDVASTTCPTTPTRRPKTSSRRSIPGPRPRSSSRHPSPRGGSGSAPADGGIQRYGESVVREVLGATFLEEVEAPGRPGFGERG